jgi:hypothetical protein
MIALETFFRAAKERFNAVVFRAVVTELDNGGIRVSIAAVGHEQYARWSGVVTGDRVIQDVTYHGEKV